MAEVAIATVAIPPIPVQLAIATTTIPVGPSYPEIPAIKPAPDRLSRSIHVAETRPSPPFAAFQLAGSALMPAKTRFSAPEACFAGHSQPSSSLETCERGAATVIDRSIRSSGLSVVCQIGTIFSQMTGQMVKNRSKPDDADDPDDPDDIYP